MSCPSSPATPEATTMRPRALPLEIFLLVVEAIMDEAEAKALDEPLTWWLSVSPANETEQFIVSQVHDPTTAAAAAAAATRKRGVTRRKFEHLLRISEVSHHAFRMVRQRFPRLPCWCPVPFDFDFAHNDNDNDRIPEITYVWTHPKIDFFHPLPEYLGYQKTIGISEAVMHALLHQSPRGTQTIAQIQNVVFAPVLWTKDDMEENSRALQAIPNLKVLRLGLRMAVKVLPDKFCARGAGFPVSAPEARQLSDYLMLEEKLWHPFLESGVRVMLDGETFNADKTRYLLELFRTEQGLHLRHVDPRSHWVNLTSSLRLPW